jgi:hypothetical protein
MIKTVLTDIGVKKVVRIVTDSASNMKAAIRTFAIEEAEPEIEFEKEGNENEEESILEEEDIRFLEDIEMGLENEREELRQPESESAEFLWGEMKHVPCSAHRLQLVLKDSQDQDCHNLKKVCTCFYVNL